MIRQIASLILVAAMATAADGACKPGQVKITKDCLNPPGPKVGPRHGGTFIPVPDNFTKASDYLAAIEKFRDYITTGKAQGTVSEADYARGMSAVANAPALAARRFR